MSSSTSLINYLKNIKSRIFKETSFKIVLGNEACDLDSTISSLVYAHHLSRQKESGFCFPVLNVTRSDLPLKVEAVYCLNKVGIPLTDLVTKDEIDIQKISELVLVDHHVPLREFSDMLDKVVEIVDHRKREDVNLDHVKDVQIEMVGSCTSLIAEKIWENNPMYDDEAALKMIYLTILVDTGNFSPEAKIAKEKDISIMEKIESTLKMDPEERNTEHRELTKARYDLTPFTTEQLLKKDLKIVGKVAMATILSSLTKVSEKSDFESAVKSFVQDFNFLIIMGLNQDLKRDMIIYPSNSKLEKILLEDDILNMEDKSRMIEIKNLTYLHQGNKQKSRKYVLPIVKKFQDDGN